jgi:uncharacterized protein (TIGR02466 family)
MDADRLTRLNELPAPAARDALLACCSAPSWAERMAAGRPYCSATDAIRQSAVIVASMTVTDLAEALAGRHLYRAHPVGQSVRHGSQTEQTLTLSDHPTIRAFFQAIDAPIRRHIAGLGRGDDPLRRRIGAGYQLLSVWSVRLEPGGSHTNHVHPKGWLSSACYIALPAAVGSGHEGWLKLGEPGVATAPALAPERFVRPEPGRLVLFPSYMWHGVVPFGGDERRLTVAFDVAPA